MKKHTTLSTLFGIALLLAAASFATQAFAGAGKQQSELWRQIEESTVRLRGSRQTIPEKYLVFRLNQTALKNSLTQLAIDEAETTMAIPLPDGSIANFKMKNAAVLSPELAAQYPDWRSFEGTGITDPTASGRFDWNALGFHGYIETSKGVVIIDPYSQNDKQNYVVFYKQDFARAKSGNDFYCKTEQKTKTGDELHAEFDAQSKSVFSSERSFTPIGASVRTYRLAVATTGEWSRNASGFNSNPSLTPQQIRNGALAVVFTTVNRLSGIYRRELASQFQLVNPPTNSTNNILFDDPATDPYNNTDQAEDKPGEIDQLRVNQETLDARVTTASFDIGHLYGTGGGGVAASPSLCRDAAFQANLNSKAKGYSARGTNTGDPFVVDYVAHEIGHQFGANHTYNNADPSGTCTTRSFGSAFEPGSGSTIMSYVGICSKRNLQEFVDGGFPSLHIKSLDEIITYLNDPTDAPQRSGCGTITGTNAIPTVGVGAAAYTIPALTPFTLTAISADTDTGDAANLLYSWEEYDAPPLDPNPQPSPSPNPQYFGASGELAVPANSFDVDTDGKARPIFRAYSPRASNARTFPSLNFILNQTDTEFENQPKLEYTGTHPTGAPGALCKTGETCVVGERLPTITRAMNFRVSVRDRRGGVADAGTTVNVSAAAGPFVVTAQNTQPAPWRAGTVKTVTWNVANTTAAPVGAANVNILLSTDGGATFPIVLLANAPNNGSAAVTVPNNPTTTARIKVEAAGNIFFDINNANFRILSATAAEISISGRALTATGRPIANATITAIDQTGATRTARTNSFGYYSFSRITAGQNYVFNAAHKSYSFAPLAASFGESRSDFDFVAN